METLKPLTPMRPERNSRCASLRLAPSPKAGVPDSSTQTLNLLLVEDCQDDAFLLLRELKRAGFVVHHQRVCSAREMSQQLACRNFDLIISDYCLPGFSGPEALEILKESGKDIPFILVSGAMKEETAAEAMRNGAADFLEKGRYSRLVPAIQRELATRQANWNQGPLWELPVGSSLQGYRIEERLGEGVSGVVYRVSTMSGKQLALKLLKSAQSRGLEILPRFQREMMALSRLNHPNIPFLADYGEFRGLPFLCMELLPGNSLCQRIHSLSLSETLNYLRQITQALVYAHSQGIVHRDVKPANIMLSQDGQVRLTDFGLARALDSNTLTAEGTLLGTPAYVAPEVLCGKPANALSDQYSLGCLAFEMLVGRPPYAGESPLAVAIQHINQPSPQVEEFRPDLPDQLCHRLNQMLAKSPQDRLQSLELLVQALDQVLSPPEL